MGRIVVSENMSLDGVVQDPTGEDGFRHGGWFEQLLGEDAGEWAKVEFAEALAAEALLLGRRSEEYFATRWSSRPGEWADRLNTMPKYVVSSTLDKPVWSNSALLKGPVLDEVTKLKREIAGDIIVYASNQLVRTLLAHNLVDEVRLMVFPVVLGSGDRLLVESNDKKVLRRLSARTVGDGLTYLAYELLQTA